jgi:hypothetical protein
MAGGTSHGRRNEARFWGNHSFFQILNTRYNSATFQHEKLSSRLAKSNCCRSYNPLEEWGTAAATNAGEKCEDSPSNTLVPGAVENAYSKRFTQANVP